MANYRVVVSLVDFGRNMRERRTAFQSRTLGPAKAFYLSVMQAVEDGDFDPVKQEPSTS